jgi:hypothetical protein
LRQGETGEFGAAQEPLDHEMVGHRAQEPGVRVGAERPQSEFPLGALQTHQGHPPGVLKIGQ